MPRPRKFRRVCSLPPIMGLVPVHGTERLGRAVRLTVDEYEAIRLIDNEGLSQEQCGLQMQIARSTAQLVYDNARKKLARALVEGLPLAIGGGPYNICRLGGLGCGQRVCFRGGGGGCRVGASGGPFTGGAAAAGGRRGGGRAALGAAWPASDPPIGGPPAGAQAAGSPDAAGSVADRPAAGGRAAGELAAGPASGNIIKEGFMTVAIPLELDKKTVCAVFGRAPYFGFYRLEGGEGRILANPAASAQGGAGVKAARFVVDNGAGSVATYRCGENAAAVFSASGVAIHKAAAPEAAENLRLLAEGKLPRLDSFHPGFVHQQ